jgi:nucleoid-associated protein YgaU
MQKDFKIGLGVGLLFVIGVALWLSTRPELSTKSRALKSASNPPPFAEQVKDESQTSTNEPRTINTEQAIRIHVVQKGDTLSGISSKYYGSPNQWQKIQAANHASLIDPNRLIPGTRLFIPE